MIFTRENANFRENLVKIGIKNLINDKVSLIRIIYMVAIYMDGIYR